MEINTSSNNCIFCDSQSCKTDKSSISGTFLTERYCVCDNCGSYFATGVERGLLKGYDKTKTYCYLYHNKGGKTPYIIPREEFENLKISGSNGIYNLTPEIVENWYPKTFAEKVDLILTKLDELADYEGAHITLPSDASALFFCSAEHPDAYHVQIDYIYKFLSQSGYITGRIFDFQLTPKAYEHIYELKKKHKNSKNVFVAMKFGEETKDIREAIKAGIESAGYKAVIMDEFEHNNQIVPEMLYQIRESRFVIAELSHHNNGAYYEAGYAAGAGKEVIQICSEEAVRSNLHFDVQQANSITYSTDRLDELPAKIRKRIEATVS